MNPVHLLRDCKTMTRIYVFFTPVMYFYNINILLKAKTFYAELKRLVKEKCILEKLHFFDVSYFILGNSTILLRSSKYSYDYFKYRV